MTPHLLHRGPVDIAGVEQPAQAVVHLVSVQGLQLPGVHQAVAVKLEEYHEVASGKRDRTRVIVAPAALPSPAYPFGCCFHIPIVPMNERTPASGVDIVGLTHWLWLLRSHCTSGRTRMPIDAAEVAKLKEHYEKAQAALDK